jgi:DNA helicase-2/ATP-dependent DNA helicase PcrA
MAKGLEFDQVFIMGGNEDNSFYQQFQYISATRALHELYVLKKS